MQQDAYISPDEVRKAITIFQVPGKTFEVRILGGSGRKEVISGYFRDADTALEKLKTVDVRGRSIYTTLNPVKEECFAREQCQRFVKNPATTQDTEIITFRWLFVDLDPVRPAGISSSDAELKKAEELKDVVLDYLRGIGFPEPVIAMSGNGYHMLFRVDVSNDQAGRAMIARCLKNLSAMFDTDAVKIDTTNSNPSRICKLHGTLAQKGSNTPDRPHRMSKILFVPGQIEVTSTEALNALINELPDDQEHVSRRRTTIQSDFDLLTFMRDNGLTYTEDSNDRAKIYKLDECPFDHNHRRGDAKIFQYPDGAIAFKCHHNSCRGYKWQDVRIKFDPDAYSHDQDDARIDAGYKEHQRRRQEEPAQPVKPPDIPEPRKKKTIRKLKTADGLLQKDIPEPRVYIGVGDELPILVEGTCILSAKPKLGKSWLALSMCLAVANGEDFLGYHTRKCSTLYLDLETSESLQQRRLKKALNGEPVPKNFYLDTETNAIGNGFTEQIEAYLAEDPDIGVVVIDVFQIIRTPSRGVKETEYEHAYRDLTPLNELAQKHHITIILVSHDRKAVDPDDPFSNILGSTGLQGAATQMIVMFRKKKEDPIHISVKGKTIDGLPELDVLLENAQWRIVEGVNTAEREQAELDRQYRESNIRRAVIAIAEHNTVWKGRCSTLINDATELGIPITESAKMVGGFLHRHQGRFLQECYKVTIIDNGTGGKSYKIQKFTVDTVDENEETTVDGFEKVNKYKGLEIPFL